MSANSKIPARIKNAINGTPQRIRERASKWRADVPEANSGALIAFEAQGLGELVPSIASILQMKSFAFLGERFVLFGNGGQFFGFVSLTQTTCPSTYIPHRKYLGDCVSDGLHEKPEENFGHA